MKGFAMNKIETFEDLVAWQKARALTRTLYEQSRTGTWSKDPRLANEILRASTLVMSRIAEGFERRDREEFSQCLGAAKGACAELRSQLYVALDTGGLNQNQFEALRQQSLDVSRIVGGLRAAVERQKNAPVGHPTNSDSGNPNPAGPPPRQPDSPPANRPPSPATSLSRGTAALRSGPR
jgi:four helix bundle protein